MTSKRSFFKRKYDSQKLVYTHMESKLIKILQEKNGIRNRETKCYFSKS